jgi:ABC-2 type transport system permease protein
MLGKIIPYLGVGAVQVVVVLSASSLLFGIPFVGSVWTLMAVILAFVLALVLLGYFISTVARTQMQALQLTFFFFLPSIMLSGFMFPFRGMPVWAQWIGEIFPITHFLRIVRALMLKGAELPEIAWETSILVLFIFAYATVALVRFRRTLD